VYTVMGNAHAHAFVVSGPGGMQDDDNSGGNAADWSPSSWRGANPMTRAGGGSDVPGRNRVPLQGGSREVGCVTFNVMGVSHLCSPNLIQIPS
jgi:hypothetical protein